MSPKVQGSPRTSSTMEMKIDEPRTVHNLLMELFNELPATEKPTLGKNPSASQVLSSVVKYVKQLKASASSSSPSQRVQIKNEPGTPSVTPSNTVAPVPLATPPPAANKNEPKFVQNDTTKVQSIYLPPGGRLINVPGVGQTISIPAELPTLPPGANPAPTIVQLPPGAKVAITQEQKNAPVVIPSPRIVQPPRPRLAQPRVALNSPRPTISAPISVRPPSTTYGSKGLPTGAALIRNKTPVTIMRRGKDGKETPITIIPTSRPVGQPFVLRPPSASATGNGIGQSMKIAGVQSLSKPKPNILVNNKLALSTGAGADKVNTALDYRNQTNDTDVTNSMHYLGFFCKTGCKCRFSDDNEPMSVDYKRRAVDAMEWAVQPNELPESYLDFANYDIRHALFSLLLNSLKRSHLHAFLRFISPDYIKEGNVAESFCMELKVEGNEAFSNGIVKIQGKVYSVILALHWLFRRDKRKIVSKKILTCRKECRLGNNVRNKCKFICINPWHYETTEPALMLPRNFYHHTCESRLRIFDYDDMKFICPNCQDTRSDYFNQPFESIAASEQLLVTESTSTQPAQDTVPKIAVGNPVSLANAEKSGNDPGDSQEEENGDNDEINEFLSVDIKEELEDEEDEIVASDKKSDDDGEKTESGEETKDEGTSAEAMEEDFENLLDKFEEEVKDEPVEDDDDSEFLVGIVEDEEEEEDEDEEKMLESLVKRRRVV